MFSYPYYRQSQNSLTQSQAAPMVPLQPIGTTLPTGMPAGPTMTPMPMPTGIAGAEDSGLEPQTVRDPNFLPGFLRTQIGKTMRVQFLIGTTGPLVDRVGTLLGVGANYILMRPQESDDLLTGDLYSIKFVDILQ